jgi:hypothetical protein
MRDDVPSAEEPDDQGVRTGEDAAAGPSRRLR